MEPLSANVLAPGGRLMRRLLLAANDPPGRWKVRVIDPVSGAQAERPLLVE